MSRSSLRKSFLLIAIPLTLLIIVVIAVGSYLGTGARVNGERQAKAALLASAMAESTDLRMALFNRDGELAGSVARRYEGLDEEIEYIVIQDDQGQVLALQPGRSFPGDRDTVDSTNLIASHGSDEVQSLTVVHQSVDVQVAAQQDVDIGAELLGDTEEPAAPRKLGRVLVSINAGRAFTAQMLPMVISGGILVLAVLVVALVLMQRIFRRLTAMVRYARTVATGDLAQRLIVTQQDEMGELAQALNQMGENLSSVLARVAAVSAELRLVIDRITHSAAGVAKGSERQWSALERARGELDEMAQALREIARNVSSISQWTRESSDNARQIGDRNTEVKDNLTGLAQAADSLSASVEQVGGNVTVLARHVDVLSQASGDTESAITRTERALQSVRQLADSSSALADQVAGEASTGTEAVTSSLGTMQRLDGAMGEVRRSTASLTDRIETVAALLRGISDVARRTNLLSLNAAIIASQAGEHGRQFQVVAEEVKALSGQTAGLTRDIEEVLTEIGQTSEGARRAVDDASQNVSDSTGQVERTGELLSSIMSAAAHSATMSQDIARAMAEREGDLGRVTQAMEHVVAVTGEIHKVTQTQLQAVSTMREAAATIAGVSDAVGRSTAQQLEGSTRIGEVLSDISDNVEKLSRAQSAQVRGGDRILETVEEVRQIADHSREEAQNLEHSVEVLALQAQELSAEMERFILRHRSDA
ncbi:MAG: methyl-accepting chemotaxis protein [Pseudomonadota bacterium]